MGVCAVGGSLRVELYAILRSTLFNNNSRTGVSDVSRVSHSLALATSTHEDSRRFHRLVKTLCII